MNTSRLLSAAQIAGQALLVAMLLASLWLWPPRAGAMLVVPLADSRPAETANLALSAGARILAMGPVRGSLVVDGSRERLLDAAWRSGFLLIAADGKGCMPQGGRA